MLVNVNSKRILFNCVYLFISFSFVSCKVARDTLVLFAEHLDDCTVLSCSYTLTRIVVFKVSLSILTCGFALHYCTNLWV